MGSALAAAGALVVALVPWSGVYAPGGTLLAPFATLAVVATVALVVPIVVAGFGKSFRWSALASVGVYLLTVLLLAIEPVLSPSSISDGYASALSRLLSSTPPLLASAGTLVPAVTLAWVSGVLLGELLARTRVIAAATLVPIGLLLVSHSATARPVFDRPPVVTQFWFGAVFFLLLAVFTLARRVSLETFHRPPASATEQRNLRRAMIFAVLPIGVALLMVGLLLPRLEDSFADPVAVAQNPVRSEPVIDSPLATLEVLRTEGGNDLLFSVNVDQAWSGYLHMASFDTYDGGGWAFEREFVPTGFVVGEPPASDRPLVRQEYVVEQPFPTAPYLLPAVEAPVEVSPVEFAGTESGGQSVPVRYDPRSRMLWSIEPLRTGATFEVVSSGAQTVLAGLPDGTQLRGPTSTPVTRLSAGFPNSGTSRLAGSIADRWLALIEQQLGRPLRGQVFEGPDELELIADWMRRSFTEQVVSDVDAAGGEQESSLLLSALDVQVRQPDSISPGSATPEQLATLYALLADRLGVPARLAVGFRLVDPQVRGERDENGRSTPARDLGCEGGEADPADPCREVYANQAAVWAEIFVAGEGWVVVDPQPLEPDPADPLGAGGGDSTTTVPGPPSPGPPSPGPPLPGEPLPETTGGSSVVLIGLVVLALLATVFLGSRRLRRRARRRRGTPLEAAQGAWLETLDLLGEARLGDLAALGSGEVVGASFARFGDSVGGPVGGTAAIADRAVFSSAPIGSEEVEAAWSGLASTRRALRRTMSVPQRVAAYLRSLVRRT